MLNRQETLAALAAYEAQPTRRALLDALEVRPHRIIQALLVLGAIRIGYVAGLLFERKLGPLLGLEGMGSTAFFWANAIFTGGFHILMFLRFYEKTLFRLQRRRLIKAMAVHAPELKIDKASLSAEGVSWAAMRDEHEATPA